MLFSSVQVCGQVVINEISPDPANNDGLPQNQTGEFIELYNTGASAVNIGGWIVADGDAAIRIPSGASIAAGGYYLIASYGLNNGAGGTSNSGISCNNCDFKGITVDANWGLNSPNAQRVGTNTLGCTSATGMTPVGSPDCSGDGNKSEHWILFDAAGEIKDAVYWGTNDPCAQVIKTYSMPAFGALGATTVTVTVAPFDGSNTVAVATGTGTTNSSGVVWKYAGSQLNGCNSSYQRQPNGGNWANGTVNFATLATTIGTFSTGAQPTGQPTNHPTPRASNSSVPFTFSVSGTGLTLVTSASNPTQVQEYRMCSAAPVTFTYVVNNYQQVQAVISYATTRIGSFVSAIGAGALAPTAWTVSQNTPAAGQTTLTYTVTPPLGSTTYQLVWEDYVESCCGGTSLNTPTDLTSCAWECYESRKVRITVVPTMTATKTTVSCPGDFTAGTVNIGSLISGGTNVTYELFANGVSQGSNSTGIFTIANTLASPLKVTVTDGSACNTSIDITINDNCKAAPICPTLVLNTTTTTASGSKCPGDVVSLCVDLSTVANLPNNGTVEWYKGSNSSFNPYTSPLADRVCSSLITNIPGCPTTAAVTSTNVVFNRIIIRPATNNAGNGGEYVQIVNLGPCPINIGCWGYVYASSAFGSTSVVRVPANTILNCGAFYEFVGSSTAFADVSASSANGAAFYLFNSSGAVVQSLGYGNFGSGVSGSSGGTVSVSAAASCSAISVVCPNTVSTSASPTTVYFYGNSSGTPQHRGIYRTSNCVYSSSSTEIVVLTGGANTSAVGGQCSAATCSNAAGTLTVPCCTYTIKSTDCNSGNIYIKGIVKPIDASCNQANATVTAGPYTVTCPTATFSGGGLICNGTPAGSQSLTITSTSNLAGYTVTYMQNGVSVTSPALTGSSPYSIPVTAIGTYEVVSLNAPVGSCSGTITGSPVEVLPKNPTLNYVFGGCTGPALDMPTVQVFPAEVVSGTLVYSVTAMTPLGTMPASNNTGVFTFPTGTNAATVEMDNGGCKTSVNISFGACPPLPPLPVTLLNIAGERRANQVVIYWKVAQEQNVNRYVLEKSKNGRDFYEIGYVKASNRNEYSLLDISDLAGTLFYRIRVIDADGKYSISPVVRIMDNSNGVMISAYPIPAKDMVTIGYQSPAATASTFKLVDVHGKLIWQKSVGILKGTNSIPVSIVDLPTGTYFLQIITEIKTDNIVVIKN